MADHPMLFSAPMVRAILEGRKTQTRRLLTPATTLFNGAPWYKAAKAQTWDWDGAWVDAGPSPAGNVGPYLKLAWKSGDANPFEDTVHRIYARVQVGDRIWGREAHTIVGTVDPGWVLYRASGYAAECQRHGFDNPPDESTVKWRPSIHMPRWTSRLTLVVTDVRLERLQDISEDDACAEGIVHYEGVVGCIGTPHGPSEIMGHGFYEPSIHPEDEVETWHDNGIDAFVDLWNSINAKRAPWDSNPWVIATTFEVHKQNIDRMSA